MRVHHVSIMLGWMLVACGGTASEEDAARISQRIVGGSRSTSAQDATVYLSIGEDGSCTGTLITANLVLTARHCVSEYGWGGSPECGEFTHDLPASIVRVHLGVDAPFTAAASWAKKVHRPAGSDGCDDIALVELQTPITEVAPVAVRFTAPVVGEQTSTVGYGENGYGWIREERWQRTNLQIQGIGPTTYAYVTRHGWTIPVDVPAKTIATGESTCYGDSGGPLLDASGAVIGVTSRGIDDHCVDRPTLYTATASFETFIRSTAAAAGHPLAGEVKPETTPIPTEKDPDPDARAEKSTPSSSDDDLESEGLDDPSEEQPVIAPSACSASPKRTASGSAVAALVLVAAIAAAARRVRGARSLANRAVPMTLALLLVACSSTPPYEGTPLAGSRVRDDGDDDDDDDDLDQASLEAPDGTTSSSPEGACGGEVSQAACFECCNEHAPEAVEVYTSALESCLCESPGACKTACEATLCAGYKADAECAACLRDAGSSCEDSAFAKCESDAACKGMLDCASESKCSSK